MKFWSPVDAISVRIALRIIKVPGMVPGQTIDKVETKVCLFKNGLYETNDALEIEALKLHHTYGGVFGTGEGAYSSGMAGDRFSVRNAFFLLPDEVMKPKSALELNPQLQREVAERNKIISQARTVGIQADFSSHSSGEIMQMIKAKKAEAEKVFADVLETEAPEMATVEESAETQEVTDVLELKPKRGRLSSRFAK